jgi:hypothetical protein
MIAYYNAGEPPGVILLHLLYAMRQPMLTATRPDPSAHLGVAYFMRNEEQASDSARV